MKKTIRMNLTDTGLKNTIKYLESYKKRLQDKSKEFCDKLAELGIQTARANVGYLDDLGNVTNFISFYKEVEPMEYGCKAIVYGIDAVKLISTWRTKEGIKSAEVSALLMAEFGSGSYAMADGTHIDKVNAKVPVGQGTFPNQKHAFDSSGWSWLDISNNWHHSKGIKPTMPMFKAWLMMETQIKSVAKEVFK